MAVLVALTMVCYCFGLLPQAVCKVSIDQCTIRNPLPILHKYYQSGDFIIAAITSQIFMFSSPITFENQPSHEMFDDLVVLTHNYQHILALLFAIKEINEHPCILPNITLGFHIFNSHFSASWTYLASMELHSTEDTFVPNYNCDIENNPIAVIGGPDSDTCRHIATILSIYKIPQISYGSAPALTDKAQTVFYQMFPNAAHQYTGILKLLLYFRWTWIGVISVNDGSGERLVQDVLPVFSQSGICFDFIERFPTITFSTNTMDMLMKELETSKVIMRSTAKALVVHGETETMIILRLLLHVADFEHIPIKTKDKVWIMTAQMDFTSISYQRSWGVDFIHGSLSFARQSKEVLGFQKFLQMKNHVLEKENRFLVDFWEQAFDCLTPSSMEENKVGEICTGEENLESLPGTVFEMSMSAHSYSIYNAIYSVAYAFYALHPFKLKHRAKADGRRWKRLNQVQWQVVSRAH